MAAFLTLTTTRADFAPVTKQIGAWVQKGYYPGAALRVVQNDHVIYDRCFGSYKPGTVVYIASAGKWLAAATIASVVDQGRLSWDDRVDKWLPEFTDRKGSATLRQLLSHTAGFPDYQPPGVHPDNYQTLSESVTHIVDLPSPSAPGEEFHYGGLAMQVAGRMAELASGKEWEVLFQERIARPLGMRSTHFTPVDPTGGHNPMLGGGARTTLVDYCRFLEMISHDGVFHGKRILSRSAIMAMQADQVGNAKITSEPYVSEVRGLNHNGVYGLGEWREKLDGQGNAVLLSSPSWAGAYPWIDKTRNLYGFIIAHVDTGGPAHKDHFNSFLSSPTLYELVAQVVDRARGGQHP